MDQLIIHSLAIHQIIKQPEQAECEIYLSETTAPITEASIEILAKLDQQMERKNDLLQGYLMEPDESLFAAFHTEMIEAGRTRAAFLKFSQDATRSFQQSLNGVIGAKGGFIVFADYAVEEQRILGVYFVQSEVVSTVELSLTALVAHTVDVPNFAKPSASLRILSGPGRNVQLSRNAKQSSINQYFTDWCGIVDPETSAELTAEFLDAVEELPLPKDRDSGYAMNDGDFEQALLKYAKRAPQQTIRVKEFDQHFYGNETPLADQIDDQVGDGILSASILSDGFKVDNRAMRKHYNLKASFGGLAVACTQDHFRDGQIEVEEQTGKITIINPEVASLLLDAKGE